MHILFPRRRYLLAPIFLPGLLGIITLMASSCMIPSPTPQPFSPLNPNMAAYLAGKCRTIRAKNRERALTRNLFIDKLPHWVYTPLNEGKIIR